MTAGQVRRKGRPPKSEKGPATTSISMRVRPEVYEDIRRDAEKHGRSVAAQAERRVAYPEPEASDAARMIGLAIAAVEQRAGKSWSESEAVKMRCRAAAEFTLNVILGSPIDLDRMQSALTKQVKAYGQSGLTAPTSEELDGMFAFVQNWLDGLRMADETLEAVLGPKV